MICTKLKILSVDNEDLNGIWFKDDVEFDMYQLGCTVSSDTDWIEWVIDHDFESELEQSLANVIKNNAVREISFIHNGSHVTVIKTLQNI